METNDDRRLLDFSTYEDYLDSFVTKEDLCYLRSTNDARTVAALGYRSTSETLSKIQFENRKAAIREILFPSRKPHILAHDGVVIKDIFLEELAERERSNRVGVLSTIIYLRHHTKSGFEISGYIDFEQSLRHSRSREEGAVDWTLVFASKKRLWPQSHDLGFFDWRSGNSLVNDTFNYKVITDPIEGLIFMNRHDRKTINVDPLVECNKLIGTNSNTTRTIINSKKYDHVVLYDHVLRKKS